ncbi:MAG: winged helix-turn-helix domain-containing protein [Candidatus Micrarchaeota archaeon]
MYDLQDSIVAYKTSGGPNFISEPILPVEITPVFDMILAHNIADGTVINPKKGRLPYFGYRQLDKQIRSLYITKLESVFGRINFPNKYYLVTTRPYCPPVLSSLFFNEYKLNTKSFLSRSARIPKEIMAKSHEYILAVLVAFIIDEGWIDSTLIGISVKNIGLSRDLRNICSKLGYKTAFTIKGEYGTVLILRNGMRKFFEDYKKIIREYPEMSLGGKETKIENSFKIYNRPIYKTKGNKENILNMLEKEPLTINQIALRINMTRQGVRFHIHNLEKANLISKAEVNKEKEIVYKFGG